ncbi:hypothetical protein L484_020089 [Morus notabilis]|uniref:Uncharacterized protein n=1 Tax=Morus notabilis TaxID=981085 RepID=W9RBC8_9ROSA|nr:hypothetical protein L484_020089 [Morus notabilis]
MSSMDSELLTSDGEDDYRDKLLVGLWNRPYLSSSSTTNDVFGDESSPGVDWKELMHANLTLESWASEKFLPTPPRITIVSATKTGDRVSANCCVRAFPRQFARDAKKSQHFENKLSSISFGRMKILLKRSSKTAQRLGQKKSATSTL